MTQKAAATAFCVVLAIANRWWRRYRTASSEQRLTSSCSIARAGRTV